MVGVETNSHVRTWIFFISFVFFLSTQTMAGNSLPMTNTGRADSIYVLDSTKSFYWENESWNDSLSHRYFYYINGQVEYTFIKRCDNDLWDDSLISNYTYDDQGRIIERINQDFDHPYYEYVFERILISYNPDGLVADSVEQYFTAQLGTWDDHARWLYTYDPNGNQTEEVYQIFQWSIVDWDNQGRSLMSYDDNNNLTIRINQWSDDVGVDDWRNIEKDSLTYDGSNNLIDSSTFVWDTDHWDPAMKITYAYNGQNQMIEEHHQYEDEGSFVSTWKFTYDYDMNGNQDYFLEQYWSNEWDNSWRETRTFNGDNNITENIGEYWNWSSDIWVTYDRHTYNYDPDGNPINYLEQLWDNSQWNNAASRNYYYSYKSLVETGAGSDIEIVLDSGVVILFDSVSAAGNTSITIMDNGPPPVDFDFLPGDSGKYIFITTDAEYIGGIEICFPYSDSLLTAEEESTIRIFHYTDAQWVDITTSHDTANNIICGTTVNLSPFVLGMPTQPLDVFENDELNLPRKFSLYQNYPNPFNPSTIINYSLPRRSNVKIEIYNILGQTVRQLTDENRTAGNHSVTWDGLDNNGQSVSTGVYFYRITADNFTETKKMLLLK